MSMSKSLPLVYGSCRSQIITDVGEGLSDLTKERKREGLILTEIYFVDNLTKYFIFFYAALCNN